ncbi:MAG: hypothetical protein ACRCZO_09290 [Cetobacterium sp.]
MSRNILVLENSLEEFEEKLIEVHKKNNIVEISEFRDRLSFGAVIEVE